MLYDSVTVVYSTGTGTVEILLTMETGTVHTTITIMTLEHGLILDVQLHCPQSVRNDVCFLLMDETAAQRSASRPGGSTLVKVHVHPDK